MPSRLLPFVLPAWVAPGLGVVFANQLIADITPAQIGEYLQLFNTWLLILGGTGLVLWQQRCRVVRAEAIADEEAHRASLRGQIEDLAAEAAAARDLARAAQHDRDELREKLDAIFERLPDSVCPFLQVDGRARCHGAEAPIPAVVADTAEFVGPPEHDR